MDALHRATALRRLCSGGSARKTFTVAELDAILAMRKRPRPAWSFTLPLLRVAVISAQRRRSDAPKPAPPSVRWPENSQDYVFEMEVPFAGEAISRPAHLTGLLFAGLEAERDPSDLGDGFLPAWRRLMGRAINEALGEVPRWVELTTPLGGRRFEQTKDPDRYDEHGRMETTEPDRMCLRVGWPKAAWMTAMAGLLGREDRRATLASLWRERLPLPDAAVGAAIEQGEPLKLLEGLPAEAIALGEHGRLWVRSGAPRLWLVRDGVRLLEIRAALLRAGAWPELPGGEIECDALSLTVDENDVVRDESFELLVAWADALRSWMTDEGTVYWPEEIAHVVTVSRQSVATTDLPATGPERGGWLYTWPHRASAVPSTFADRVLMLSPPEVRVLRRQLPEMPLLPVHILGSAANRRPIDLASLAQRSFPPLKLPAPTSAGRAPSIEVTLSAYVHRYPGADEGEIQMLAYGRRIARVSDPSRNLPGVTLVASLRASEDAAAPTLNVEELLAEPEGLRHLADRVHEVARANIDTLTDHAVASGSGLADAWSVPLIRHRAETADPCVAGLHYSRSTVAPSELGLSWSTSALLALVIGEDRNGQAQRLIDALHRAQRVGGVVVGERSRRWYTLESDESEYRTWILHDDGRALLRRLLGPAGLWSMPIVPQTRPHPRPAAQQRALLLSREEVAALLLRRPNDPSAAQRLMGHLLVARALGEDELGLGSVPLLGRYDPRGLVPWHDVSLDAMLDENPPPRLTPVGAASRSLPGPVIAAGPGIAALLHELHGFEPAPRATPDPRLPASSRETAPPRTHVPVRRQRQESLATVPVAAAACVGALHLIPGTDGIELWGKGLHVDTFHLPGALHGLSGRLWLTPAGTASDRSRIVAACLAAGIAMVDEVLGMIELLVPGSQRRQQLEAFVARLRSQIRVRDELGLRARLGDEPDTESARPVEGARLDAHRSRWLPAFVRHALQRPVKLESAILSWKPAKVTDPGDPGVIEVGRRHRWIKPVYGAQTSPDATLRAATLVVLESLAQAPHWGDLDAALRRLLAPPQLR